MIEQPTITSMRSLIRGGYLSLDALIDALDGVGYITERIYPDGCELTRPGMQAIKKEDFDEVFEFFYPGRLNDIHPVCIASNESSEGYYSHAVYNASKISHEDVKQILRNENILSRHEDNEYSEVQNP